MINKLIVGRNLNVPLFDKSPGPDVPGGPAHFVSTPGRNYQVQVSAGSGFLNRTRTSAVAIGQHATKAHRNFRWLHWQPGKITYLPLVGADILTGEMSGCWVVIFTMGGQLNVAHIGTYTAGSPATLQVKVAWANAFQAGLVVPVAAFQPNQHLVVSPVGFCDFYAVVTAAQTLHALRLDRSVAPRNSLSQIATMNTVNGAGVSPGDPGHANFV